MSYKIRHIIIYPLLSVECNIQDEDNNIHDASQGICKFHHIIIYMEKWLSPDWLR